MQEQSVFTQDRLTSPTAVDGVYQDLRGRILRLELKPDAVLVRNELAEQYKVSLTPIREALQSLEQDGLVRILPQSGTLVTRIDPDALQQAHFLRLSTEVEVARRLATSPAPTRIKRAQAIVGMQSALIGDPDQMDMFSELDRNFHRTLFEGAGVEDVYAMVARRQGHMARCQRLELPGAGRMESIVSAHREVLEGIASGKPQKAADAMRRHLTGTITRVDAIKDAHPDFFTP